MKTTDQVLAAFLRAVLLRMKALGLNHTTLAARLKVARPYVTKVLHGNVNISFGAACRLAKALEMDFIPTLAPKPAKSIPSTGSNPIDPHVKNVSWTKCTEETAKVYNSIIRN